MSGVFGKIFGGSKSSQGKAPTPQEAIQKLIEVEELLRKRQDLLERKIDDELKVAKANGVKNKRGNSPPLPALLHSLSFHSRNHIQQIIIQNLNFYNK